MTSEQSGITECEKTFKLVTDGAEIPVERKYQPPGKAVGNAIEVAEAFEILGGKTQPHSRLERLSLRIASEMILLSGKTASLQEAETVAEAALRDGRALKTFAAVIEAQGGDSEAAVDPKRLPQAAFRLTVHARESGFITAVDTEALSTPMKAHP